MTASRPRQSTLAAFELRLALFEERRAALAIVLAVEARHRRARDRRLVSLLGVNQQLADRQPRSGHRQRRVVGDGLRQLEHVRLELLRAAARD